MVDAEVPTGERRPLGEVVPQLDPLAHERDLLGVVELETKGAGAGGRRQRGEGRSPLEDDGTQARAGCEEGRCAADDPATDDDEVGRPRQVAEVRARVGHRASLGSRRGGRMALDATDHRGDAHRSGWGHGSRGRDCQDGKVHRRARAGRRVANGTHRALQRARAAVGAACHVRAAHLGRC